LYVAEADHDIILAQFSFLALDENVALPANAKCSADILQSKVEQKLALQPADKDMIVMLHEIDYELNGETKTINSSLVVKGEDSLRTAMAKTVGLPLGIAAKLILEGKIMLKGLHIPTHKEIYGPVLEELKQHSIIFEEQRK
jgi:saccharopine dehydrogenase-like NADP-dependent oxidoreductase